MTVHGKPMRMPLSHNLPTFLRNNPTYDKLPRRLSAFIRRKYGRVDLVDVGANIGDSVLAFQADRALAIEANPKFFTYLQQNVGTNVTVVECLCSDSDGEGFFRAEESHGSAAFHQGGPLKRPVRTVDALVKEHRFEDFNILKIDTDGHDLEVLAGAKNALGNTPAVLFECYAAPSPAANLATLKSLPFKSFLLYSDKGHLMGRHSLSDLSAFEDLLYYAMAADVHFDILLLREDDMDEFHALERAAMSRPPA
jgi:FkbM family methyltransferase